MGTAAANHIAQNLGVLQHRAGTQMVAVEGLALVIFLEQGLLQAFQQALVMDVGAGVMDEYAGLHIAVGVDVSILAATGDTAVNVLAVVLEVQGVEGDIALGRARTRWIMYSRCSGFSIKSTLAPSPMGI